ncbi:hypothetical protein G3I62_25615 [Streptomyces sp. SID14446]|uniref:HD domain-containing protein n=1 Tax=Streptomyces sp. SID14446 TaxID=2706072 RepID=UPI0013BE31BC|nr:ATP-binding protein [Streptomyces sp. SID14446]NEB32424.1 hypothetical protein [Streptomyces sp. SID14446]
MAYKDTHLWSLFEVSDGERGCHQSRRLVEQFNRSREHIKLIAAEINRDAPNLTQHDISHIDALWEYADLICGDSYNLNPAELYVLGIAFLVHDLANGVSAIPGGLAEIARNARWKDSVATEYRALHGVYPAPEKLLEIVPEVHDRAVQRYLRETHAEYAAKLPQVSYSDPTSGSEYYLIEDVELRTQYGHLAGKIAASHWWPTKILRREFGVKIGARAGMPDAWHVDPLVLSCILRCADAAHLDSRRAPAILRAIRKPAGESEAHWVFQDKLQKPHLKDDRLVYTSLSPFKKNQAEAWWLCYESLTTLDGELSAVDTILSDTGRNRFRAKSVAGVKDLEEISRNVTTEDWHPIDARVKVTDVVSLVSRLGGKELYGANPRVALRELVTNAADAVRAKKAMLTGAGVFAWEVQGDITVGLKEEDGKTSLVVRDTGIGMSRDVLAGALLNFGTSYWDSVEARRDLPGLISSGFRPTGQFGIGFFSVFMIGDSVKVISRRYDAAASETFVLEFQNGITQRPMLRNAESNEQLPAGGTEVRVILNESIDKILSIGMGRRGGKKLVRTLAEVCAWLCPALDVDLYVSHDAGRSLVVEANDWQILNDEQLVNRLYIDEESGSDELLKGAINGKLLPVACKDGEVAARVAVSKPVSHFVTAYDEDSDEIRHSTITRLSAPVIVGGVRSSVELSGVAGLVLGRTERAARDLAIPLLEARDFAEWASQQALSLENGGAGRRLKLVELIAELYGDTAHLHIATSSAGPMDYAEVVDFSASRQRIIFVHDAAWWNYRNELRRQDDATESVLNDDVLLIDAGRHYPLGGIDARANSSSMYAWSTHGTKGFYGPNSVTGRVLAAVARAWEVEEARLSEEFEKRDRSDAVKAVNVGKRAGSDVRLRPMVTLTREGFF